MFRKLLIANRGEIACRIARTCRRLGIAVVGVHSEADADALHVREIGDSLLLGPAPTAASYLDIARVVEAARRAGADAVHPGYGFLAENPAFARALAEAGIAFIGPDAEILARFGDKAAAKQAARRAGVPVVPGTEAPMSEPADVLAALADMPLPVLLKAAAGGGGKGMRVIADRGEAQASIRAAMREAAGAFGDPRLIVEHFVPAARHVEVQILGDGHGNVIHLLDRECSLQRRHQKIIEEAPCTSLDPALRDALFGHAVRLGQAVQYLGLGTVEFIVRGQEPFFLEVNPRIQVEHPATEEITGLDLVELQLRAVAERRLPLAQVEVRASGVAVEARLYAEDASRGFLPATGRIVAARFPAGVRVDAGVQAGSEVTQFYDPMIAKLIAHGPDRASAWARLDAALAETVVLGVVTNLAFMRHLAATEEVRRNALDTGTVDRMIQDASGLPAPPTADDAAIAAALWLRAQRGPANDPWTGEPALAGWRLGTGCPAPAAAPQLRLRDGATAFEIAYGPCDPAGMLHLAVDGQPITVGLGAGDDRGVMVALHGRSLLVCPLAGDKRAAFAWQGRTVSFRAEPFLAGAQAAGGPADGRVRAPMVGRVIAVEARPGQRVRAGDRLIVIESMKMELLLTAPVDGTVSEINCDANAMVERDQLLVVIAPHASGIEAGIAAGIEAG